MYNPILLHVILQSSAVTGVERLVLCVLAFYADERGEGTLTRAHLSSLTQLPADDLERALEALNAGHVVVRWENDVLRYHILAASTLAYLGALLEADPDTATAVFGRRRKRKPRQGPRSGTVRQRCEEWIVETLRKRGEPIPVREFEALAKEEGFSRTTFYRARQHLHGIVINTEGRKSKGNAWALAEWFKDDGEGR